MKKLLTGLFRFSRKSLMTTDNDKELFRSKLIELVDKKDSLDDEEVIKRVEEIKKFAEDLPESEDKGALNRYLEDFKAVKEQDEATAKKAAETVADLYEKLDIKSDEDAPIIEQTEEKEKTEEIVEKTEDPEVKDEEEIKEEKKEEVKHFTEDELNEIFEYLKKKETEDECATKDEEEKIVTDGAPVIPVTITQTGSQGSLADMFKMAKGGK